MKSYSIIKQEECQGMIYYEIIGKNIAQCQEDINKLPNIATGSIFYDISTKSYHMMYYEGENKVWKQQ